MAQERQPSFHSVTGMKSLMTASVNDRIEVDPTIDTEAWQQNNSSAPTPADVHELTKPRRSKLRFFPWTAAIAVIAVIGCWALMIGISIRSNNDLVTNWTVQPAVYFALATAVSNFFTRFAFTEAVAVHWWYKSLKGDQTLMDLHKTWAIANSIVSAATSMRAFGILNAASIACAFLSINSPLLQRSSTVMAINVTDSTTLSISSAKMLPDGYTGIISGREYKPELMTPEFIQITKDYINRVSVTLPFICEGSCHASVLGAGFTTECNSSISSFDSGPVTIEGGDTISGYINASISTAFSVSYSYNSSDQTSYIFQRIVRKQKANDLPPDYSNDGPSQCAWEVINQDCSLLPAIVSYPVVIAGNTIILDPNTTYKDDQIIQDVDYIGAEGIGLTDTLGGIYLMLSNTFASNVVMSNGGTTGWQAISSGNAAQQYLANSSDPVLCNWSWTDPTDDLFEASRNIMFRTALKAAEQNSSMVQQISGSRTRPVIVYQSNYLFLGLSIAISTLTIILVTYMLHGWKILGKKVTLSPVDTAQLIDGYLLRQMDTKMDIAENLKQHGDLKARSSVAYSHVKSR